MSGIVYIRSANPVTRILVNPPPLVDASYHELPQLGSLSLPIVQGKLAAVDVFV
jgi:hypothetical protein